MKVICTEPCCRGKDSVEALPAPPPRQPYLIRLESADGLRSEIIAQANRKFEYRTVIAPRVNTLAETASPQVSLNLAERRYQYDHEEWDEDAKANVRILREVVDTPKPKPKIEVCEAEQHKWCYKCSTNHKSLPPRLVTPKA